MFTTLPGQKGQKTAWVYIHDFEKNNRRLLRGNPHCIYAVSVNTKISIKLIVLKVIVVVMAKKKGKRKHLAVFQRKKMHGKHMFTLKGNQFLGWIPKEHFSSLHKIVE